LAYQSRARRSSTFQTITAAFSAPIKRNGLYLPPAKWTSASLARASACTVLIGYIPRQHICVAPGGYLGFHWATAGFATQELWSAYPSDIRLWISQHGGLSDQMLWLQAPSIYRYFRKC
jgi:hypothetical protein